MRVLLLKDVKKVGKRMEVKDVSEGYARNFLLPNKLAVPADDKAMALKQSIDSKEQTDLKTFQELAKKLEKEPIEFKVKTGGKGEVFGAVSEEQIKKALMERGYGDAKINLIQSLKNLGENKVEVNFGKGIRGAAKIILKGER